MGFFNFLRGGKNSKIGYYIHGYLRRVVPRSFCQGLLRRKLSRFDKLPDSEQRYILDRVDYYCRLSDGAQLPEGAKYLGNHRRSKECSSPYFFDSYEYTRFFADHLRWVYRFGDVNTCSEWPSITKSRPIVGDVNSVILKLNKNRHFVYINDKIRFRDKLSGVVFRGDIYLKPRRIEFIKRYFDHPMCDFGVVGRVDDEIPEVWRKGKMSIYDHLKFKFVMALEGNDVASNLKWIMSSSSIAVMPRPRFETWFMEDRLVGGVHYIEIVDDYSDLEERLQYYIDNPTEAEAIIRNANSYVAQFRNKQREDLISLMVLDRYFERTGQNEIGAQKSV